MADAMVALPKRIAAIELKLDHLARSVDARFDVADARIDARFDEVTTALVEQREYTEFSFDRLRTEIHAGFAAMPSNFGRLERKLDRVIDYLSDKP